MASIKLKGDTSGEVTISAPAVAGTNTLTLPAETGTLATHNSLGVRNLIINGDMRIDQRNAGASVTPTLNGYYSCDRWTPQLTQASKYSVQQSSSAPSGFTTSQVFTTVSGYTIGAGDYFGTEQRIEGYNVAHLDYGTSNAKTTTLSFWVKSNKTGTFCGSMHTTGSKSYVFNYTISSANTWEYKTIEITGDTVETLNTTNGDGLRVRFTLTAGTNFQTATTNSWIAGNYAVTSGHTNVIATTSDNLYITGVQLEVGTEATPFEHRPYDMELQRCMRYYERIESSTRTFAFIGIKRSDYSSADASVTGVLQFKVQKRANANIEHHATDNYSYHYGEGKAQFFASYRYVNVTDLFAHFTGEIGAAETESAGMVAIREEAGKFVAIEAEL